MKYITIENLKPGMILSNPLYNERGNKLLSEGQILQPAYIEKIIKLGYSGIYIKDEFSKEVNVPEIISTELRINAVKNIKNLFILDNNNDEFKDSLISIQNTICDIIESVISNQNVMINMIDLKTYDDYTYYHSVNVSVISITLGIGLGLSRTELEELGLAAILHDIGKKFIPLEILNKPDKLTEEEFNEIKKHPLYGYNQLKHIFINAKTRVSVLQHHEKWDGTGYPYGKKGTDILLYARIISISDVYDAIISKRSYHKPLLPSDAIEQIMASSSIFFDPKIVSVFLRKVAAYPIGTSVMLNNGVKGLVVENFPDANTRPIIKTYPSNDTVSSYINLKDDINARNLVIVKVISE